MQKNRLWYIIVNILPILVSILMFATITNNQYHLWIWYDALVVPIYLLLCNFALNTKAFSGMKLLIVPCVLIICFLLHMLYFNFDMSAISSVIWIIFAGIAFGVMVIGGIILYFVSKRLRSKKAFSTTP